MILNREFEVGTAASSPLRVLREKKGMSQKTLAEKLEIDRTRLVRLEQKGWSELSLGDLTLFSKGLDMSLQEILSYFKDPSKNVMLERSHLNRPFFKIDSGLGYHFDSLLKNPGASFIGALHLAPKSALKEEQSPQAALLFYFVLEGELLLTIGGKEYCLKEKECFALNGPARYELYNPHQIKEAAALLITIPSFVRNV